MKTGSYIKRQKSETSEYSAWDGNNRRTNIASTFLKDGETLKGMWKRVI